MTTLTDVDDLESCIGEGLGTSDWVEVTQDAIDAFAQVTGDHQWIHTDPVRAQASPFGGTIAHGYYTLSLGPRLLADIVDLERFPVAINYGLDKVRFPAPLRVGARVRARVTLDSLERKPDGAMLAVTITFEAQGVAKPVCIAQTLVRTFSDAAS